MTTTLRPSISARASAALLLFAGPAVAGESSYEFVDLGTLGGPESVAYGLNDERQVVGWSHVDGCVVNGHPCRRAFLWDNGVMVDLGLLPGDEESFARAINNAGLIVGTSESNVVAGSGTYRGVQWSGGVLSPLPDLGDGQSFAHDVNEAGHIVGHAQDPSLLRDRAVTWDSGLIANIGSSDTHQSNRAYGISDSGWIAGFAWNLFEPNDAIVYNGSTWFTIGGVDSPFQNAEARDINDAGTVVGLQAFPSGSWHAAVWSAGSPAIDLGTLPGDNLSELYDISSAGEAVGRSYADFPVKSRAVYYNGGDLIDMTELLPEGVELELFEAREVNERGDIAGTALVDGLFRAFLLLNNDDQGPWEDVGLGLAGTPGLPSLAGQGSLIGGTATCLTLENALPSSVALLAVGFERLDLPLLGGTLVPTPTVLVGPQATGATGGLTLALDWPVGLPPSTSTYWQYWIFDAAAPEGWAASNGLVGTTP